MIILIPDANKFTAGNSAHIKNIAKEYGPDVGNIELRYSINGMKMYIIRPKRASEIINRKKGIKSIAYHLSVVSVLLCYLSEVQKS